MNNNAFSRLSLMRFVLAGAIWLALDGLALAQQSSPPGTIIYTFQGRADGAYPQGSLICDTEGALYGVMANGVFQLKPPATGQTAWTETVIASVLGPQSGLIFERSSLYGVSSNGYGTIFQLSPPVNGQPPWTQTTLWTFNGGADGVSPQGPLVSDTWGALYGVTSQGGTTNAGTVFKLTPPASGQTAWRKTVLWNFGGGEDGAVPQGGLIFDHRGALYGATLQGGAFGLGTVYQLTPPEKGSMKWRKTVLHSFRGNPSGQLYGDGAYPYGSLIFDTKGSLYGATSQGGFAPNGVGYGTVFRLTPPNEEQTPEASTSWRETLLNIFNLLEIGHGNALGGLIFDTEGALYGTTVGDSNDGTVFKMSPPSKGQTTWSFGAVYGTNGIANGGVIFGQSGAIYGTTANGGPNWPRPGYGQVFQISP